MEPQVSCPHLPENTKPVSEVKDVTVNQVVIGSCTNGRISDMRDAAEVLKGRKVAKGVRCIVLPATPTIWRQAMKEGLFDIFTDAGCIVGPPTCGPCLGGHMGILGDASVASPPPTATSAAAWAASKPKCILPAPVRLRLPPSPA